jgi:5'(3')-deoxyribonucleotidase
MSDIIFEVRRFQKLAGIREAFEERPLQIYFDMDGVLADFEGGFSNKSIDIARRDLIELQNKIPEFKGKSFDELKAMLAGIQKKPSHKALKNALYDMNKEIYAISGQEGFFLNLPEMPGARTMLEVAIQLSGRLPHILTAPVKSEFCQPEKEQWMIDHFDGLYDQFYCQSNKEEFANPDALLIDDRMKNINIFREAGGQVIYHTDPEITIKRLREIFA